jgi:hypothetical protein
VNIEWAKRKVRRILELENKIASVPTYASVSRPWKHELAETKNEMKFYHWGWDLSGMVTKIKNTNDGTNEDKT